MEDEASWYVIQVRGGTDAHVATSLGLSGYRVFRPIMSIQVRHRRTKKWLHKAFSLFPGYLFIQMAGDSDWAFVLRKRNVLTYVGFDGEPTRVRPGVVEELMKQQEQGDFHKTVQKYARGDRVTVNVLGRNVEGTVDRHTNEGAVHVLVEMMGGNLAVEKKASEVKLVA